MVYPPDLRSLGLATFIKEVEESLSSTTWFADENRQQRTQERLISEYFVSNLEDLQVKLDHSVRSHVHAAESAGDAGLFAASSESMQGLVRSANGSVLYIADGARGFRRPDANGAPKKNLEVRDLLEAAGLGPGTLDEPFAYKSGQRSLRRHGLVIQVFFRLTRGRACPPRSCRGQGGWDGGDCRMKGMGTRGRRDGRRQRRRVRVWKTACLWIGRAANGACAMAAGQAHIRYSNLGRRTDAWAWIFGAIEPIYYTIQFEAIPSAK